MSIKPETCTLHQYFSPCKDSLFLIWEYKCILHSGQEEINKPINQKQIVNYHKALLIIDRI